MYSVTSARSAHSALLLINLILFENNLPLDAGLKERCVHVLSTLTFRSHRPYRSAHVPHSTMSDHRFFPRTRTFLPSRRHCEVWLSSAITSEFREPAPAQKCKNVDSLCAHAHSYWTINYESFYLLSVFSRRAVFYVHARELEPYSGAIIMDGSALYFYEIV